jgi:hypothetical protein
MNDDELNKLLRAARDAAPDTSRLEYGFETRLLARIRGERAKADAPIFAWAWRLTPWFAGVVVALGVWAWYSPAPDPEAVANSAEDNGALVEYFTGNSI